MNRRLCIRGRAITMFATAIALGVGCLTNPLAAAGAGDGSITVEEYKRLVVKQRAAIDSMRVSYQATLTYDSGLTERGLMNGRSTYEKTDVAFKGEKRYSQYSSKGLSTDGKPIESNTICVFTGADSRMRDGSLFHMQKERSARSEGNTYCNAMLWPVTRDELARCQSKPGETYFLPYFLDEASWSVLPGRQQRGKVACLVFKKSDASREVWLDPSRGFALIYYQQERPIGGTLRWTSECENHFEALPGVFLPRRIITTHELSDPRTGLFLGKTRNVIELLALDLNKVPDSLFSLEPRPGDWVVDNERRVTYRYYPPGDTTLVDVVEEARREYGGRTSYRARNYIVAANVVVLMVVASYVGGRWRRARRE